MKMVLLVEPDEILRAFYELELRDDGFDVVSAGSISDAAAVLETEDPDVLIADYRPYPDMSSRQMLQLLNTAETPIIILSCVPLQNVPDGLSKPAACVIKSSNTKELKKQIQRLTFNNRQWDDNVHGVPVADTGFVF